jgi:hypothetical protein
MGIDSAPTGEPQDFWSRDQINELIREQSSAPNLTVRMKDGPTPELRGLAEEEEKTKGRKVLWLALGMAGVALIMARWADR